MPPETHYQTLEISETATQAEIKRAYRRLAKQFHPDSKGEQSSHERIARINTAYEIIGDPSRRTVYDQQRRGFVAADPVASATNRARRTADMQEVYRYAREATQSSEAREDAWLKLVYGPVDRLLGKIMSPLRAEIRKLSADPFDDELMEGFMAYLEQGRTWLGQAQDKFNSMSNPASTAGVAADLYHCLGLLEDGLDELDRFTMSYEESYIHTGEELFRRVKQIRAEAKERVKGLV